MSKDLKATAYLAGVVFPFPIGLMLGDLGVIEVIVLGVVVVIFLVLLIKHLVSVAHR